MEIPSGPQAITTEWLTEALRETGTIRQAKVESIERASLGELGITGQLARLTLTYDRHEKNAPQSLIAKFPALDAAARETYRGHYMREVGFYQEMAANVALRTPQCYYSHLDAETLAFVLLLEDLAPARCGDWVAGCSLKQAEFAIRQIAAFHAAWWENPELSRMSWLPQPSSMDFSHSQERYLQQLQPFLNKMAGKVPAELSAIGETVGEHYISIMQRMQEPPRTIIHNDYQLGNLFLASPESEPSLVVIDWQTVAVGLGAFDVAYFLGGNITSQDRRAKEMDLLRLYHAVLVENGVQQYPFDAFFDDYRFCMLRILIRYVLVVGGDFLTAEQEQMFCNSIVPRYIETVLDFNVSELLAG